MKISTKYIANHIINLLLYILVILFNSEQIRDYSQYLYLFFVLNYLWMVLKKNNLFLLFTPTAIMIFYIGLSFSLGAFAFKEGYVLQKQQLIAYNNWEFLTWSSLYILTCLNILFYADHYFSKIYIKVREHCDLVIVERKYWRKLLIFCCIIYLTFTFLPFSAGMFGGSGDMSIVPKTIAILIVIYYLALHKIRGRYLYYGLILIVFAFFSVQSKREAIFLVFPIGLVESYLNLGKIRIKYLFGIFVGAVFCIYLILLMSIVRGYGGFDITNSSLTEAIPLLVTYLKSDLFLESFFNNIETNYTYYHSFQALEYVQNDPSLLTFGSTIIKFLFIFIPRSIFPGKPDSILELYTSEYSPSFRAIGGSYPINIFSEYFWNFHFLGVVLVLIMVFAFHFFFKILIKNMGNSKLALKIWLLYAYMQIITYVRGSGLDQYFVYIIMGLFFSIVLSDSYKLLSPKLKYVRN